MDLKSRIEAVLFVTGRALKIEEISEILETDVQETEAAMLDLIYDYSCRAGALEIDDENGYIIQIKEEYSDIAYKLCPIDISEAVLKTLAVIALKEPIRQSSLKELRGSNIYEHVKELEDKGLITKYREKNSRAHYLKTTPKFFEYFKIKGSAEKLSGADNELLSELLELKK